MEMLIDFYKLNLMSKDFFQRFEVNHRSEKSHYKKWFVSLPFNRTTDGLKGNRKCNIHAHLVCIMSNTICINITVLLRVQIPQRITQMEIII